MTTHSYVLRIAFCSILLAVMPLTAMAQGRDVTDISNQWLFAADIESDAPAAPDYNDTGWQTVNIPHTWNATDAQDGCNDYLRTTGWYRKSMPWQAGYHGRRLYLEFRGANTIAECFVNGHKAGAHKGGYTAFRFDITDCVSEGSPIDIAVKVDNRRHEECSPLSADFSFFGGIYRKVYLVAASPLHIDMSDCGSSALYLTPTCVSEKSANLEIRTRIVNNSSKSRKVTVRATLRHPDSFAAVPGLHPCFDPAAMAPGGKPLKTIERKLTVPAGRAADFRETTTLENPHLWNGRQDPYRYRVDVEVLADGKPQDSVTDYVGFRTYSVPHEGFFLNGRPYPLRGVNRHQDREGMGNAITEREHDEDFAIMYEMGANALRLAHYPQDRYFLDLCDRYGIVTWQEIPFVNEIGDSPEFADVQKGQLREMIRQYYNCPSICFWGLHNEVRSGFDKQMKTLSRELNELAHEEDSTRLTVFAVNHDTGRGWDADLIAYNSYPGWYIDGGLGDVLDRQCDSLREPRPAGLSEYGAGGSIYHHAANPAKPPVNQGRWHPEEYQTKVHEECIRALKAHPTLWGSFLWCLFDFASDWRSEGDRDGINDKGLVTYDRKVRKDSYYAYKVNWNPEPEVYIAERRFTERTDSVAQVRVYSNCDEVELLVNGVSQGVKRLAEAECGFYGWDGVMLSKGINSIVAKAKADGRTLTDKVEWTLTESKATAGKADITTEQGNGWDVTSKVYRVDKAAGTIDIPATKENTIELPTNKFMDNLTIKGNVTHSLNCNSYFVQSGDTLVITDSKGRRTTFKIRFTK